LDIDTLKGTPGRFLTKQELMSARTYAWRLLLHVGRNVEKIGRYGYRIIALFTMVQI